MLWEAMITFQFRPEASLRMLATTEINGPTTDFPNGDMAMNVAITVPIYLFGDPKIDNNAPGKTAPLIPRSDLMMRRISVEGANICVMTRTDCTAVVAMANLRISIVCHDNSSHVKVKRTILVFVYISSDSSWARSKWDMRPAILA